MAAVNAPVYLLHGGLVVLTTAGAAPEHEALGQEERWVRSQSFQGQCATEVRDSSYICTSP